MQKLSFKRGGLPAAVAVIAAVGVSACGSSSNGSNSSSSTGASTQQSTSGAVTAKTPADIATLQKYLGTSGKADPSKSTVDIGFINLQGGTPSAPEAAQAAQAAVDALNNNLGGINGHPVKLVHCYITADEEQGQACGQEMVNNPNVKLVVNSAVQIGADALHQTLGTKIVDAVSTPLNLSDVKSPDSFALNAGLYGSTPGEVNYVVNDLHAKKVAVLGANNDPAAVQAVADTVADLKKAGVQVTTASFSDTATNLLAPFEAAGVASADAVIAIVVGPPVVIATAKALKELNVKVPILGIGAALQPGVKTALGDYPQWTYNEVTLNAAVDDAAGEVASFKNVMAAYEPTAPVTEDATFAFSGMITSAKVLDGIKGSLSTPTIAAAFKAFKGPGFLDPPSYNFGAYSQLGPGLGTLATRFFTYDGNGKWSDATNGKWIG